MSEIERAIKVLEEEYAFTLECDATQKRSSAYKTALAVLRAELDREKNPKTWNERINQMTVEEKAPYFVYGDTLIDWEDGFDGELTCTETPIYRSSLASDMFLYSEQDAIDKTVKLLNSPYTEGETK